MSFCYINILIRYCHAIRLIFVTYQHAYGYTFHRHGHYNAAYMASRHYAE